MNKHVGFAPFMGMRPAEGEAPLCVLVVTLEYAAYVGELSAERLEVEDELRVALGQILGLVLLAVLRRTLRGALERHEALLGLVHLGTGHDEGVATFRNGLAEEHPVAVVGEDALEF